MRRRARRARSSFGASGAGASSRRRWATAISRVAVSCTVLTGGTTMPWAPVRPRRLSSSGFGWGQSHTRAAEAVLRRVWAASS
jgi:hypothetical protein